MRVIVRKNALRDLDEIYYWISKDSPSAAAKVVGRILTRINRLAVPNLSQIGRPRVIAGAVSHRLCREFDANAIVVLSIVHTARNREPGD